MAGVSADARGVRFPPSGAGRISRHFFVGVCHRDNGGGDDAPEPVRVRAVLRRCHRVPQTEAIHGVRWSVAGKGLGDEVYGLLEMRKLRLFAILVSLPIDVLDVSSVCASAQIELPEEELSCILSLRVSDVQ